MSLLPVATVALVSATLLAAEVVLPRLFALWFRPSYTYLIVASATCGMAIGAMLVQLLAKRGDGSKQWVARLGAALSGVNGVVSLLGGVAAAVLAKFFGYGAGLLLAIAAYALAWPAFAALGRERLRANVHAAQ